MSRKDEGLSRSTQEKIGKYLFDLPDEESKGWDMRTRIKSKEMMNALTYLGVLAEILKSENARKGKDTSSIFPFLKFETLTKQINIFNIFEEIEETIEYDIYVDLPPLRKYKTKINIQKIRKGEPIIVIPDEI